MRPALQALLIAASLCLVAAPAARPTPWARPTLPSASREPRGAPSRPPAGGSRSPSSYRARARSSLVSRWAAAVA